MLETETSTKLKPNFKRYLFFAFKALYSEKLWRHFWTCNFWKFNTSWKKNKDKFRILMKSWVIPMFFMPTCWFKNLTLFRLTLTWNPSKVKFDDLIGSSKQHCRYRRAKWPGKPALHSMLVAFIFSKLLWPDHDFALFKCDLRIHAIPFPDI